MLIVDVEHMSQMKQLYSDHAELSPGDDDSLYPTFTWQSPPEQFLLDSPCGNNTTVVDDGAQQAHAYEYGQRSRAPVQSTVLDVHSCRTQAAQPKKPGLNSSAATFVPSRFVEYGYFPPPHGTPEAWLHILDIGMLASDPTLPVSLVQSCSWSSTTLRDLAQLFCWEILAKANIVDFGPEAALFARQVHETLAIDRSEWLPSCFASHLQECAVKHFKSFWCSLDNPDVISPRSKLDVKRWNVAMDFSCFVADLFSFGLIQSPIMHECLGILLHEMVSVQHVRVIQAMVKRAGPTLWQTADSHERRQEFTARFVERTRLLPDYASLTERGESICKVVKADNIVSLISEWQAQRSEYPPPAVKSIWGLSGLNMHP